MFFNVVETKQIPIKIAKYLKVPYGCDFLNLFVMQCRPYKNVHDGLYYVKAYDDRTYFYCKNDLIAYVRKSNYEVAIFTRESLKGTYEVIRINKLKGVIRDEDTMLISVNGHIRFAVSRNIELQDNKKYVAIVNVSNGEFIMKSSKDEEIYLGVLSLFYHKILPIIQVKTNGIFIYLIDLLSESSYTMEWTLSDIKQLVNAAVKEDHAPKSYIETKKKILHDNIVSIGYFDLLLVDESVDDRSKNHLRTLTFVFNIKANGEEYKYKLEGLIISIEANVDKVTGILHFNRNNARVLVTKESPGVIITAYATKSDLGLLSFVSSLRRTYSLNKTSNTATTEPEIKINMDFVYNDGCHSLVRNVKGIMIKRLSGYVTYTRGYHYGASINRYKQYVFVLMSGFTGLFMLAVIDLKNDLMIIFSPENSKLRSLMEYKVIYYFYPIEKYAKLVFIHSSLEYMFILDTRKLEQIVSKVKADREIRGCGDFYGEDVIDTFNMEYVGEGYYLPEMIYNSIQAEMSYDVSYDQLSILGHYFDSKNYKMYFIVKLIRQDVQKIGLLAWDCAKDKIKIRFQLVCYSNSIKNNDPIATYSCGSKRLVKHLVSMKNMTLYSSMLSNDKFSKPKSLYLSNNRFIDVECYRFSYKLFGGSIKLKVYRIEDVIWMRYFASLSNRQDDLGGEEDSSFCFVLSRLQLVRSMRHVIV